MPTSPIVSSFQPVGKGGGTGDTPLSLKGMPREFRGNFCSFPLVNVITCPPPREKEAEAMLAICWTVWLLWEEEGNGYIKEK